MKIRRREYLVDAAALPQSMHPVLRRIYAARGVRSSQEIDHRLAHLCPPDALGGLQRACEILEHAIRDGSRIIVVGDFDADGATGTAVAVRGLRALGARDVGYAVPNRSRHGYGLSPAIIEELASRKPDLLITVDNGIAAHAGVDAARTRGMRVIITDHHLPGETAPAADAIVNPNQHGDAFPSKALAGVGVMFYVLLALRSRLRTSGWFSERGIVEPDLSTLLDLVAAGTVADLVPLDYNNRILVEAGLRRIRSGQACAGIAALITCGKRDAARLVSADLGFVVGPRINAAGRLEDMSIGIECLLTDDAAQAQRSAETLSAINSERRDLQVVMVEQAQAVVAAWITRRAGELPHGIVLFDAGWHQGVVGLVASKLKESLGRPVIACAPAAEGSFEVKASGRSIEGFHLRDALAEIDARYPGLMQRFGGHAMAAGLTLKREDIDQFAAAFDDVARERISAESLSAAVLTDGAIEPSECTLEAAEQLRFGGPWGQGFPEPRFDGEFDVVSWKVVGENHLRLVLKGDGMQLPLTAIAFGAYEGSAPPSRLRAVFNLDIDEWNGARQLRLLVHCIEPCS